MPDLLANALADKVVSVEVMFMAPLVQPESLEVLHDPDRTSARCAIHSATVSNRCIFVCNTCKLHGVSITYSRSLEFRRHIRHFSQPLLTAGQETLKDCRKLFLKVILRFMNVFEFRQAKYLYWHTQFNYSRYILSDVRSNAFYSPLTPSGSHQAILVHSHMLPGRRLCIDSPRYKSVNTKLHV